MSKRRHKRQQNKFPQTFYRQIFKLFQAAIRGLIKSLLRSWYRLSRQFRFSQAGFVLPTITVVLLIFSIVVGSLLFGASQRTTEVIGERENQVIYNAATPAIERAKAKLEYLFQSDDRFPVGVPGEELLNEMMLTLNLYTLPDETRIDINGDDNEDNAWTYKIDSNRDGDTEDEEDNTIAYSILMLKDVDLNGDGEIDDDDVSLEITEDNEEKAINLVTRTGPLSISANAQDSAECGIDAGSIEDGWFPISSATVRKNFQVNAVVTNPQNNTVTALEFQQDRQLDRGNKFGAWFRYDLIVHPGPQFNWNGAMHTDGSLIAWNDSLHFYLVSSPKSCVYTEDASEITVNQVVNPETNQITYQGQVVSDGNVDVDIFPESGGVPNQTIDLTSNSDSVDPNSRYGYTLDPLVLFTTDELRSRYSDSSNKSVRDNDWDESTLARRLLNKRQSKPYIDDTYRADNRWGPKPTYGTKGTDKVTKDNFGLDIANDRGDLINNDPPAESPEKVGVDGYWERRAYNEGLRVIVGQRLELGNAFGWSSNDPLYPPTSSFTPPSPMNNRRNEYRQQRTLRDNLAAVQATAIYHSADNSDFPAACLATTAHPGTLRTIANSTTFTDADGDSLPETDFLTGNGTNGWEFEPPQGSLSAFETAIDDADSSLKIALSNLAYFAGDPDGAFPPKQETSGSIVHPYPHLAMWGDSL